MKIIKYIIIALIALTFALIGVFGITRDFGISWICSRIMLLAFIFNAALAISKFSKWFDSQLKDKEDKND